MTYIKPAILKEIDIPNDKLLINETFHSLQGEGYHTGTAAFFIRFAGCDIGCKWCDSKDALSVINSTLTNLDTIVDEARRSDAKVVVITGGEPLLFDLRLLTGELKKAGMEIHIETSGAYKPFAFFDWLTLSPKKIHMPINEIYSIAREMKIIIHNKEDFHFAESQLEFVSNDCKIYLQPEWSTKERIIPQIIDYIKKKPHWRLSLQTHKYLGIP